MTMASGSQGRTERVVLAMVAARIGISAQSIFITLVLGEAGRRLWWLLFSGLAICYATTAWRYPRAEFKARQALVLLAFVDIGLTVYEAYTILGSESTNDGRFFWINVGALCIQLIPPLVVAALVGKAVAQMRHSRSSAEPSDSFALPDGRVVRLEVEDERY